MSDQATNGEHDGFAFIPGRYFEYMAYLDLPALPGAEEGCAKGGNISTLIWRYDHEPNTWHFQWRFRYYRDSGPDEMVWFAVVLKAEDAEDALEMPRSMLKSLYEKAKMFGAVKPPEELIIQGDCEAFLRVVAERKPSWLGVKPQINWHAE